MPGFPVHHYLPEENPNFSVPYITWEEGYREFIFKFFFFFLITKFVYINMLGKYWNILKIKHLNTHLEADGTLPLGSAFLEASSSSYAHLRPGPVILSEEFELILRARGND